MNSRFGIRNLLSFGARKADIVTGGWGKILPQQGWHELESGGGECFRWAESGAGIEVQPLFSTWLLLDIDLEPGPSLGGKPLKLEIRDGSGDCVARIDAKGRQVNHVTLPVSPYSPQVYSLHVADELVEVPGDPRQMAFRVFSMRESEPILSPMLRFESGWYGYEKAGGACFRWAENGASFQVHAVRANPVLSVDLEPGPGTDQKPFRIDVTSESGERVYTTSIKTRDRIQTKLPMKMNSNGIFRFSVDESMVKRAPEDTRSLSFRLFGMGIN